MKTKFKAYRMWSKVTNTMSPIATLEQIAYAGFGENLKSLHPDFVDVMEYTNTDDQKGNKIFERDIVEFTIPTGFGSYTKERNIVGWCEHHLNWACYPIPYVEGAEHYLLPTLPECVVIGDMWRNPELLTIESNGK